MRPKIDLITIVTNKLQEMHLFYRDVLGFKVKLELDSYVEFESPTVRFALTTNKVMKDATNHESYSREKQGQSVELAFPVTSPSDVDKTYESLIKKGAFPVKSAKDMAWGQRAAFIADPDGNIHEIFAELPKSAS